MPYLLGEIIALNFDVQVNDVDTEPGGFTLTVTKPDGTVDTVTGIDNPDPGVYTAEYQPDEPGHYTWLAVSTGAATGVQQGVLAGLGAVIGEEDALVHVLVLSGCSGYAAKGGLARIVTICIAGPPNPVAARYRL